jgi:hypothetical protein
MSNNKIYVAIASYRDQFLNSTIESLYANAKNPENITVGCFIQSNEVDRVLETPVGRFSDKKVFYDVINPGSIFSVVECRKLSLQFLIDEAYVLQVDAHTRFHKDWDSVLLNYIKDLPKKSALSTYIPTWKPLPTGEEEINVFNEFLEPTFTKNSEEMLIKGSITLENAPVKSDGKSVYKSWYLAGGFIFARTDLFRCINQQDWITFWGEEFINSLSAASQGWDVYIPYSPPLSHLYHNEVKEYVHLNKIFHDFPEEHYDKSSKTHVTILNMLNNIIERKGFTQAGLDKVSAHLGYDLVEYFNNVLKDS